MLIMMLMMHHRWFVRWRRYYLLKLHINHDYGADYDADYEADDDMPDEEDGIYSPMTEWWSGWAPSFSSLSTKSQADTPGSSSRLRRCFAWVLVITVKVFPTTKRLSKCFAWVLDITVKVSPQWHVWAKNESRRLRACLFQNVFLGNRVATRRTAPCWNRTWCRGRSKFKISWMVRVLEIWRTNTNKRRLKKSLTVWLWTTWATGKGSQLASILTPGQEQHVHLGQILLTSKFTWGKYY